MSSFIRLELILWLSKVMENDDAKQKRDHRESNRDLL